MTGYVLVKIDAHTDADLRRAMLDVPWDVVPTAREFGCIITTADVTDWVLPDGHVSFRANVFERLS